jgi:NADPH:quinone reductase-like Zn-dependent oxidoreductase
LARIIRYHQTGSADVLQVEETDVAPPAAGEVRIRVEAIGLNRADILVRSGLHPIKPRFPAQIGAEAAGRVEAVGEGVDGFAPGDAVSVIPRVTSDFGTCAEFINVPVRYVQPNPAGLNMAEAAALWIAALTVTGGMIGTGRLGPADTVLLPAASSSVGIAAIQLARFVGAVPIAVTRGRDKADRLLALGAHDVIVSDEEDVATRVDAITGGEGVRLVFDPIGGPGVATLAGTLAPRGGYVIYGSLSFDPTPFPVAQAFARDFWMRTYALDPVGHDLAPSIRIIREAVARGVLRPAIGASFPLDRVADAYRIMESNRHVGKIVLTV